MNVFFNPNIEDVSVERNLRNEAIFEILFEVLLHTGIYSMYSLQDAFFDRNLKIAFSFVAIIDKWTKIFLRVIETLPSEEDFKNYLIERNKPDGPEFPISDPQSVKIRVESKIINMMLDPEYIGLMSTLLFLGFPSPKLIFMSTILRMDTLLFNLKINACKVLDSLLDFISFDEIDK